MATPKTPTPEEPKPIARNLRVARAAAQAAVAASKKTGRPVDPRVKALAESR
jgi:hypothetical protein